MTGIPEIIPVTDLGQDAGAILGRVQASHQPVVITQHGRAAVIMLSVAAYERREREFAVLQLLARGEREIKDKEGHDLAEVLAEADALLADSVE